MRVRATLQLRNDALLSARERMRLPQKAVVQATGVPIHILSGLERLQFDGDVSLDRKGQRMVLDCAKRLADFFELDLEEVLPRLAGVEIHDVTRVADVQPEQLARLCSGVGAHTMALTMDPADGAEVTETRELLEELLKVLPERQAFVVRSRYGIGCEAMPYSEIAKVLGISASRCSQIEDKALRSLRQPYCSNKLREALGLEEENAA